uniref:Replication protein A 14 kDa subunit B n=1 Tax=Fagus sylvatica TaxID=28930 RepID=A0A2N9GD18_FAGSY
MQELLRLYVGRKVRAVIQVLRSDGGVVTGKSTDENQIIIKGSPSFPLSSFVEVIGIADSDKSIRAEIWTNFGTTFDPIVKSLDFWGVRQPISSK